MAAIPPKTAGAPKLPSFGALAREKLPPGERLQLPPMPGADKLQPAMDVVSAIPRVARGVAWGAADIADVVKEPENLALMALSRFIPTHVLKSVVSGGFSAKLLWDAFNELPEARRAFYEGRIEDGVAGLMRGVAQAGWGVSAGKGGAREFMKAQKAGQLGSEEGSLWIGRSKDPAVRMGGKVPGMGGEQVLSNVMNPNVVDYLSREIETTNPETVGKTVEVEKVLPTGKPRRFKNPFTGKMETIPAEAPDLKLPQEQKIPPSTRAVDVPRQATLAELEVILAKDQATGRDTLGLGRGQLPRENMAARIVFDPSNTSSRELNILGRLAQMYPHLSKVHWSIIPGFVTGGPARKPVHSGQGLHTLASLINSTREFQPMIAPMIAENSPFAQYLQSIGQTPAVLRSGQTGIASEHLGPQPPETMDTTAQAEQQAAIDQISRAMGLQKEQERTLKAEGGPGKITIGQQAKEVPAPGTSQVAVEQQPTGTPAPPSSLDWWQRTYDNLMDMVKAGVMSAADAMGWWQQADRMRTAAPAPTPVAGPAAETAKAVKPTVEQRIQQATPTAKLTGDLTPLPGESMKDFAARAAEAARVQVASEQPGGKKGKPRKLGAPKDKLIDNPMSVLKPGSSVTIHQVDGSTVANILSIKPEGEGWVAELDIQPRERTLAKGTASVLTRQKQAPGLPSLHETAQQIRQQLMTQGIAVTGDIANFKADLQRQFNAAENAYTAGLRTPATRQRAVKAIGAIRSALAKWEAAQDLQGKPIPPPPPLEEGKSPFPTKFIRKGDLYQAADGTLHLGGRSLTQAPLVDPETGQVIPTEPPVVARQGPFGGVKFEPGAGPVKEGSGKVASRAEPTELRAAEKEFQATHTVPAGEKGPGNKPKAAPVDRGMGSEYAGILTGSPEHAREAAAAMKKVKQEGRLFPAEPAEKGKLAPTPEPASLSDAALQAAETTVTQARNRYEIAKGLVKKQQAKADLDAAVAKRDAIKQRLAPPIPPPPGSTP